MRDEVKIAQAKVSAVNSAREHIKRLVELGATDVEIIETIAEIDRNATAEAQIRSSEREAKKLMQQK